MGNFLNRMRNFIINFSRGLLKLKFKEEEKKVMDGRIIIPPEDYQKYPSPTTLIFSPNEYCEKICMKRQEPCSEDCSYFKLQQMVNLLKDAKVSICLCMTLITNSKLANAIIDAHQRGIRVQVIVDKDFGSCSESAIENFLQADIIVKTNKNNNLLMHHKFCVTDALNDGGSLMMGSLNWTAQGVTQNYEYVVIFYYPQVVKNYFMLFNSLWKEFGYYNSEV